MCKPYILENKCPCSLIFQCLTQSSQVMQGLGKDGKINPSVIIAKENTFILIQGTFIDVEEGKKNVLIFCCPYCACGWNHITSSESCNAKTSHGKFSHGNRNPMLPLTKGHPIYGGKQETSQRKPEKQKCFHSDV